VSAIPASKLTKPNRKKNPSNAKIGKGEKVSHYPFYFLFTKLITGSIKVYRVLISSHQPDVCNFVPSCSHFGYEAISKYGIKGILMTFDRLERCNYFAWFVAGKYYSVIYDSVRGYKLYDPVDRYK